jgi:hypothetical protein
MQRIAFLDRSRVSASTPSHFAARDREPSQPPPSLPIRAEVLAHFIPRFALDSIPVSTAHSAFGGERYPSDG